MPDYLPLVTAVVSFAFFLSVALQYLHRGKTHQLLWSVALLFYSASACMEFLMNGDVLGASPLLFRAYYVLAAPLVGLLGAGVVWLLARRTFARLFLGFVVVFSLALAATGFSASIDAQLLASSFSGPLANGFMAASTALPMSVRIFAIVLNAVGGLALIGGALLSFVWDRSRNYNLFIAIGGILPMLGGSLLGFLNYPDAFFEFELGGTVFLFLGFMLSSRYIAGRDRAKGGHSNR
ncbi:MAG: hypothetical protein ABSB26_06995 [Nitrososphaerales archaeon]